MTIYEIISIIVSILSAIAAVACYLKANRLSREYNNLVTAQVEMQMRIMISDAKARVQDICLKIPSADELKTDSEKAAIYSKALNAERENVINAYEEACAKYLDKKIDCERFRKTYQSDIRSIVEDENTKKLFFDAITSRHKAILKVYKEWEDQEN